MQDVATKEWWKGPDGDAYLERNRYDWTKRVAFWRMIHDWTGFKSAIELGCNRGSNLLAMRALREDLVLHGAEINAAALAEAQAAGVSAFDSTDTTLAKAFGQGAFDLAFTAGVLIHVPPEDIYSTMRDLVEVSRQWIVAIEYYAEIEQMIPYRGFSDKLWKRPYGALYQDHGLRVVLCMHLGPQQGFGEGCTAWLMEKM